jgi:hypothetical protein
MVRDGNKNFELRKNDRDFRADDALILQEYDPETSDELIFNRLLEIFSDGFLEIYGAPLPREEPPKLGRYIIQVGDYMVVRNVLAMVSVAPHVYGLGKQAAKSLKYARRKSIRLGHVLKIELIIKRHALIYGMGLDGLTIAWKATLDVSKEARRSE